MSRVNGVYKGKKGKWSVVITDKLIAQFDSEEEALSRYPELLAAHRQQALANMGHGRGGKSLPEQEKLQRKRVRTKAWMEKNADHVREYQRQYREKNRETIKARRRKPDSERKGRHVFTAEERAKSHAARAMAPKASKPMHIDTKREQAAAERRLRDVNREKLAQDAILKDKGGECRGNGINENGYWKPDPNRKILQTEHLPSFEWGKQQRGWSR